MKLVSPGFLRQISNETVMSNHLLQVALAEPEVIPQIATLFEKESTAFTSLLAKKGLTSRGLYAGLQNESYRVVGNRKVMWPVKGIDRRKGTILAATSVLIGSTPGKGGEVITLDLDTNWFSPKDVLELKDRRTLVHVVDDQLPQEVEGGKFRYFVRAIRSNKDEYILPALLAAGSEIGFAYTMFEEMSETAYEKYTFDDWAGSWMTIQRMKWSISGTAAQMNVKKHWITHNNEMAWLTHAEMQMLKRWAEAREYQNIFGKGTVTENDEVLLRDLKGRDIVGGDGLINVGDGSLKFPYNRLTKQVIHNLMRNMQIYADAEGKLEIAVIAGQEFMFQWGELMATMGVTLNTSNMVEGTGSTKGINATYAWYEFNNVRFIPVWHKFFDSPARPTNVNAYGVEKESMRAIFVSLGQADVGTNNVELLALGNRAFRKGTIAGIDVGGDAMKSSVDGQHTHVLCETGIKVVNMYGVAELFNP
jgi:hypothetical protein